MCMFAQSVFNRRKTPQRTTKAKVAWEKSETLKIKNNIFSLYVQSSRINEKKLRSAIRVIYLKNNIGRKYAKIGLTQLLSLTKDHNGENFHQLIFNRREFVLRSKMRKQSYGSNLNTVGSCGEPQIIVEESTLGEEEAEWRRNESPPRCMDPDSPSLNPYLLSPWREARKHSLPTPQCTSGITASQVRRLHHLNYVP